MQWQPGGNFRPVKENCERSWLDCPFALVHYIWFEAVTDVVDCLTNESILWNLLAILLVCGTISLLVHWRIQSVREANRIKENLKRVNVKIQDLGLKVNILTYEIQYGTWSLQHITNGNTKIQNIQIAISKLNEENSWIKHLLKGTRKNNFNRDGLFRRVPSPSSSYSNEYDLTTREKNDGYRKSSSSSENSLNSKSNIAKLEQNSNDDELKFSTTPKNIRIFSNIPPDFREEILTFQKDHWKSKNADENFYKTKDKMENLQLTLRRYSSSDLPRPLVDPELNSTDSRYQYRCRTSIGVRSYLSVQDVSEIIKAYSSLNAMIAKNQMSLEFAKGATNDKNSISNNQINTHHGKEGEIKNRPEKLDELILVQDLKSYKAEVAKSLSEISNSNSNNLIMIDNNRDSIENSQNIHKIRNIEETIDNFQKTNSTEVEKESDSDDKSTNTLLEQALKFKKELLIQMISEKEKNELNVKVTEEETNSQNYSEYQNREPIFQPKQLDMIVEESSGSSITALKSKTNIPKAVERGQHLEEHYKTHNTFQQVSNNEILAYNKYLLESKILENEIMKQQIGTNMLINKRVDTSEVLRSNCGEERDNSDDNIDSGLHVESLLTTENDSLTQSDTPENFSCDDDQQEIEYQNQNYFKSNFNLGHLTETSSDTSVNRLLDQLIESERKCKSSKCSAESKEEEFVVDSIRNFIDSHGFFQTKECENNRFDNFPIVPDTEKYSARERNSSTELKNNQVNYVQNSITRSDGIGDDSPESGGTVIDTVSDDNWKIKKLNDDKEIFRNRKIFPLDSQRNKRDTATMDTTLKNCEIKDEIDHRNIEKRMREQGSRQERIIDKKDAGDFCSDDESSVEESYLHGNIFNETSPNTMNNTQGKFLLCGDSMLSSQKKSKSNQYHASCVTPSVIFPQKNISSNSVQKQSARSGSDLVINKQLKGKSNSLTLVEKTRSTSSHKGSKPHISPREICLDVGDSKLDKKKLNGSFILSRRKSCTMKESQNEKDLRKAFEILPNQYPKLKLSTAPMEVPINREEYRFEPECNNTFKSLIYSSDLPSKSQFSLENFPIKNENEKGNRRRNVQGSKSGNLKFAKQNYDNSSLDERSLLIGLKNHEEVRGEPDDGIENKNDNSSRLSEEMDAVSHQSDSIEMQYLQDAENSTIISMNTINENDEVVTNLLSPKQFKEYMENKIMDLQNITSTDDNGTEIVDNSQSSNLSQCHVLDTINSKTNISDCTDVSSMNSSLFQMQIFPPKPYIVNSKETEVMAKPCTADVSTSVSDLSYAPIEFGNKIAEFKILEVPEELSKEEYISLIRMINENPDLQQSTSINDICHKLGLELQK